MSEVEPSLLRPRADTAQMAGTAGQWTQSFINYLTITCNYLANLLEGATTPTLLLFSRLKPFLYDMISLCS